MGITQSQPPQVNHLTRSILETVLTPKELRIIRLNPGKHFKVSNDNSDDGLWSLTDVAAMYAAARKRDMRVVSRANNGVLDRRQVWISYDPGYRQRLKGTKK